MLAPSKLGMQNCKEVSRDLNPPIESKLSRDNLDSIGGFKSRDTFAVLHSNFLDYYPTSACSVYSWPLPGEISP